MVPPEYLPAGVTVMPQPRNMNKAYLAKFISHVLLRQASMPPNDVFQFSHWRTRNGELCPAQYPKRDGDNQPVRGTKAPVKQRKAKNKAVARPVQTNRQPTADAVAPGVAQGTGPRPVQGAGQLPGEGTQPLLSTPFPQRHDENQPVRLAKAPVKQGKATKKSAAQPGQPPAQATAQEEPMELISQNEMTQLALQGHPVVIPMNGPASGFPQYLVATATVQALRQQPTPQSSPQRDITNRPEPQIDPALLDSDIPPGRASRSLHKPKGGTHQKPVAAPTRKSSRRR